jgi:putative resolvase
MYLTSKKASKHFGVHANTLRRWADNGSIKYIRTSAGQRLYDTDSFVSATESDRKNYIYCRVSSSKQRDDLERQVKFLSDIYPDHEVIKDVGSGLNYKRKGFLFLLEQICSSSVRSVVIAHKDRLVRFGFEIVEWIASKYDTKIVVLDDCKLSPQQELITDILSIIHVFSCRIHGLRSYGKKIKEDKDLPNEKPTEGLE